MRPAPDVARAAALVAGARRVVVVCHVNPDGDALGSALALGLALSARGTEVVVSFGTSDDSGVPAALSFLPGQDLLCEPSAVLGEPAPDLLVTVDTGSIDRLGPLQPLVARAAATLVIDHHASNTGFGTASLVDASAASTTVLVTELLDALGAELTRDMATCLYVGLVTDTGQFQFSATTAEVHEVAARYIRAGVEPEPVGRALFSNSPFPAVQLKGLALARAVLEPGLVWTWIPVEEREGAKVALADVEGVIDSLRATSEAEVAVVLKGIEPVGGLPVWMVSTRSRGTVDVGSACVSLGGGGHRFAAGATLTGDVDAVMDRLRAALRQ